MRKSLRLLLLLLVSSAAIGQAPRIEPGADRGGQALLPDESLRIAPAGVVPVNPAWRSDVQSRVHPVRSLSSDDFSDLQFLKPLLAGKRVVQLGESGHGVAQFSAAKVRLVKFLHQQMGYDVIAFESSLPQCYQADQAVGAAPPLSVMRQCIFGVWHSTETLALFDYLDATRKAGKRLTLAGFDTQNSGSQLPNSASAVGKMLELDGWPRAQEWREIDRALFLRPGKEPIAAETAARVRAYYRDAAVELEQNRARLLQAGASRESIDVAIQSAKSRLLLADQFEFGKSKAGFEARDRGMADNLDFLLDSMYPGRKVIVWAHNAHIANLTSFKGAKTMGMFVAERRKAEVYTVGLFMGRGLAAQNDRSVYPIAAPDADSFDAVMSNADLKFAFVDFSTAKAAPATNWIFAPIVMREWGTTRMTVTPASGYDGVLYIDTVTPPDYR